MISVKVSFNYCKAIARCSQSILSFQPVMKCHVRITSSVPTDWRFFYTTELLQMLLAVAALLQCFGMCFAHVWGIPLSRNLLKPHPVLVHTRPLHLFTYLEADWCRAADQQMHNLAASLHIWVISQYSAGSSWICNKNVIKQKYFDRHNRERDEMLIKMLI